MPLILDAYFSFPQSPELQVKYAHLCKENDMAKEQDKASVVLCNSSVNTIDLPYQQQTKNQVHDPWYMQFLNVLLKQLLAGLHFASASH